MDHDPHRALERAVSAYQSLSDSSDPMARDQLRSELGEAIEHLFLAVRPLIYLALLASLGQPVRSDLPDLPDLPDLQRVARAQIEPLEMNVFAHLLYPLLRSHPTVEIRSRIFTLVQECLAEDADLVVLFARTAGNPSRQGQDAAKQRRDDPPFGAA